MRDESLSAPQVALLLPHRTEPSIYGKRAALGILSPGRSAAWVPEMWWIIADSGDMKASRVSELTGLRLDQVHYRRSKCGVRGTFNFDSEGKPRVRDDESSSRRKLTKRKAERRARIRETTCNLCGKAFTQPFGTATYSYCSPSCKRVRVNQSMSEYGKRRRSDPETAQKIRDHKMDAYYRLTPEQRERRNRKNRDLKNLSTGNPIKGPWTPHEIKVLMDHSHLPILELAFMLNRTPGSVSHKRRRVVA